MRGLPDGIALGLPDVHVRTHAHIDINDMGNIQLFTIIFIYKLTFSCYLQVTIL